MVKKVINPTLDKNDLLHFDETNLYNRNEIHEKQYLEIILKSFDHSTADAYLKIEIARECFELGITYFSMGKYILAARYFKKAIPFNPRLINYFLGQAYQRKAKIFERSGNFSASKKNYDKALNYYSQALQENGLLPNDMILNNLLNTIYSELDERANINIL